MSSIGDDEFHRLTPNMSDEEEDLIPNIVDDEDKAMSTLGSQSAFLTMLNMGM